MSVLAARFDRAAAFLAWPGRLASWLILAILATVLMSVIGSAFRITRYAAWETSLFVLGDDLSLVTITEMQWHFFGVMLMLGGAFAHQQNRHVRVDILYERLPPRWRLAIEVAGDLLLLVPFCALLTWYSKDLVQLAYATGETSSEGGLTDRWVIKAVIPLGLGLLTLTGLCRAAANLARLATGADARRRDDHRSDASARRGADG